MEQPRDERTSEAQEHSPEAVQKTSMKKPYVAPVLIDYGSVAKLTSAGTGTSADGPVGFMMGAP